MEELIRFLLSNFTLTFSVAGLIASAIELARAPKPLTAPVVVEALFAWFLLFSVGVSLFYNFVMHVFFGEMAARFIGWEDSPFQAEVGYASLGFSVVGFLAFRRGFELRLAAIVGPSLFMLGAAVGHAIDMVERQNFAPGNAGVMFYWDILFAVIGFTLLRLQRRYDRQRASTATARHA